MVKEYEVKLRFDSEIAAENTYMALVTAISMLRSFAGNPPRFRNNYLETFSQAEQMFMEREGVTNSEAADWTHTNLEIYFANLQNAVYATALAMEEDFGSIVPVDRNLLLEIDGHVHEDSPVSQEVLEGGVDLPEELRKQIESIFNGASKEGN